MTCVKVSWCRGNIRQVIFAARYGAHLGNYMMHCHNIVHEDHDMLRAFLVRLLFQNCLTLAPPVLQRFVFLPISGSCPPECLASGPYG